MIDEKNIKYSEKGVPVITNFKTKMKTGIWRTHRPVINEDKCILCRRCFTFCPTASISWDKKPIIDYDVCNGCGICANECPVKAIDVVEED